MPQSRTIDHEVFKIKRANSDQASMWDDYEFGRPGHHVFYLNDFFTYTSGQWTVTESDAAATQATTDSHGGVLLLTNGAADAADMTLQLGEVAGESIACAAGRTVWFETRLSISDATQSNIVVGLHVTDTSPLASAPADGIYFRKDDGDTNIDCVARNTSAESVEAGVTTIGTTMIKLGFKVVGTSQIQFWVNDVLEATLTTNIPTTEIRPSFTIRNGEAVAKTMSIDYVCIAATR